MTPKSNKSEELTEKDRWVAVGIMLGLFTSAQMAGTVPKNFIEEVTNEVINFHFGFLEKDRFEKEMKKAAMIAADWKPGKGGLKWKD